MGRKADVDGFRELKMLSMGAGFSRGGAVVGNVLVLVVVKSNEGGIVENCMLSLSCR
jgi:hypothetical protein